MALKSIGPVENFPVNQGVCVEVEGKSLAVFNTTGQYYAVDDACPHAGASLAEGALSGPTVTCPLHGARVDVRTGKAGPPCSGPVSTYDVSCDGKELFVDLG